MLSETSLLPEEVTVCEDTVSTLSGVLLNLPAMQVNLAADLHCRFSNLQQTWCCMTSLESMSILTTRHGRSWVTCAVDALTETCTSLQVDPAQTAAYLTSLGISSMVCRSQSLHVPPPSCLASPLTRVIPCLHLTTHHSALAYYSADVNSHAFPPW